LIKGSNDRSDPARFELPDMPWLRLADAVRFVMQNIGHLEYEAYERAVADVERRLTEGALAQRLRFRGTRKDAPSADPQEIDHSYFSRRRGFLLNDNEISPCATDDWFEAIADKHEDPGWRNVVLERAGFLTWYPANAMAQSPSYAPTDRHEILTRAHRMEMNPEQCEAWARD
jgi:hypothetical protein